MRHRGRRPRRSRDTLASLLIFLRQLLQRVKRRLRFARGEIVRIDRGELFAQSVALRRRRISEERQIVENVMTRVNEFASGAPQSDDITCVALVRSDN